MLVLIGDLKGHHGHVFYIDWIDSEHEEAVSLKDKRLNWVLKHHGIIRRHVLVLVNSIS